MTCLAENKGNPIEKNNFISGINPICQGAIESYSLNLGEAEIYRCQKNYMVLQVRLQFFT